MITVANANALHIPLADQSVQCVIGEAFATLQDALQPVPFA